MSPHMETYHGIVRTPADAIKLFEACRVGILPRVQRRLSEKERQSIRPGSIFVWDEREAGMRRWTDGKSWSASRVSGSFLTYREMEGKRSSGFSAPLTVTRRSNGRTPDSGRGSDDDGDNNEPEGYRYKPDGLMKQSFSITAQNGQHLHLISYYTRPGSELLMSPTSDPNLRNVIPPKGMYPDTTWCETGSSAGMNKAPIAMQNYLQNIRHMPPHPAAYPSQYAHHAYSGYPPSPITTPPYTGAPYAPGYYPPQHPAHMGPPAPAYAQHMPAHAPHYITSPQYPSHHAPPTPSHHAPPPPYSAAPPSLSPYQPSAEPVRTPISEYPPQQLSPHHPHSSYPAYTTSPREQPRAMFDTHLTSARNPQGPLPPIGTLSSPKSALPAPVLTVSPIAPAAMLAMLPPSRLSQTPPRSAGSDCKGAISSLINAEPPKGAALPAIKPGPPGGAAAHDAHAINLLNSKFRV